MAEGAAQIFFAYIGFDSISTHAEEASNPQRDLAIGIIASLFICTVLYVAVAAVLTGMVPYLEIDVKAPLSAAFRTQGLSDSPRCSITVGILAGLTSSLLVGNLSQPRILLAMARDGMLPESFFAAVHPRFQTPWKSTILVGLVVALGGALAPARVPGRPGQHRHPVRVRDRLRGGLDPPGDQSRDRAAVPGAVACPSSATLGILVNGGLMFSLGRDNWIRLLVWLAIGLAIYFGYSRYHSKLAKPQAQVE